MFGFSGTVMRRRAHETYAFERMAQAELARGRRHETSVGLLVLHASFPPATQRRAAGSHARLRRAVHDVVRRCDHVALGDGQSVIVLVPHATDEGLLAMTARLASSNAVHVGIAVFPDDGLDVATLVRTATERAQGDGLAASAGSAGPTTSASPAAGR